LRIVKRLIRAATGLKARFVAPIFGVLAHFHVADIGSGENILNGLQIGVF